MEPLVQGRASLDIRQLAEFTSQYKPKVDPAHLCLDVPFKESSSPTGGPDGSGALRIIAIVLDDVDTSLVRATVAELLNGLSSLGMKPRWEWERHHRTGPALVTASNDDPASKTLAADVRRISSLRDYFIDIVKGDWVLVFSSEVTAKPGNDSPYFHGLTFPNPGCDDPSMTSDDCTILRSLGGANSAPVSIVKPSSSRPDVALHEWGHAMGLEHLIDDYNVMDPRRRKDCIAVFSPTQRRAVEKYLSQKKETRSPSD